MPDEIIFVEVLSRCSLADLLDHVGNLSEAKKPMKGCASKK